MGEQEGMDAVGRLLGGQPLQGLGIAGCSVGHRQSFAVRTDRDPQTLPHERTVAQGKGCLRIIHKHLIDQQTIHIQDDGIRPVGCDVIAGNTMDGTRGHVHGDVEVKVGDPRSGSARVTMAVHGCVRGGRGIILLGGRSGGIREKQDRAEQRHRRQGLHHEFTSVGRAKVELLSMGFEQFTPPLSPAIRPFRTEARSGRMWGSIIAEMQKAALRGEQPSCISQSG